MVDAVAQSVPKRSVQRNKERLQGFIHDLYVLVLTAVAHIIKYLLHDTEKSFFKRNSKLIILIIYYSSNN